MKKILLKSLLAIIVLMSSTNVSAYDFEVDGIYYNIVPYFESTCKVTKNGYYSGNIVIPATVNYANNTLTIVGIEDDVFQDCSDLTGITIPNTISSIDSQMFNGCSKLENVTIEDGETFLSLGFNYGNPNLSNLGKGLFYDCPIKTIYLGRNISYRANIAYGYSLFADIKTLQEVTIGNFVTEIRDYAFEYCI